MCTSVGSNYCIAFKKISLTKWEEKISYCKCSTVFSLKKKKKAQIKNTYFFHRQHRVKKKKILYGQKWELFLAVPNFILKSYNNVHEPNWKNSELNFKNNTFMRNYSIAEVRIFKQSMKRRQRQRFSSKPDHHHGHGTLHISPWRHFILNHLGKWEEAHQQRCQGIMWPCTYNIQLKATVILDLHTGDYTGTGCVNASWK